MTVADESELKTALSRREAGEEVLLGTPESDWVDFKEAPGWNLATEKGKWDLVSDIASFANASGGIILVGARTSIHPDSRVESLSELRPVPMASLPDADRLRKLIREHIHPPMSPPVEIIPWDMGNDRFVLTVSIGKQQASDLPFIVGTGVDDEGVPRANMFGYFRREGDSSVRMPHTYVHDLMRDGFRFRRATDGTNRSGAPDLLRLVLGLGSAHTDSADATGRNAGPHVPEDSTTEATRLISLIGVADQAHLVLQSWQPRGFEVRDFFSRDGFHATFSRPPQLRHNGFNLDFPANVETPDGQTLQRAVVNRVALSARSDGLLTAVVGREHLGWAMEQYGRGGMFNPIPLVEYVVEFCRLTSTLMQSRRDDAGPSAYSLAMSGLDTKEPRALPEGIPVQLWIGEAHPIVGDRTSFDVGPVSAEDPERAAYELLRLCYAEFALGPDTIPFADTAAGRMQFKQLEGYGR